MKRARALAGIGRVARWVLLACTLFGLAAMHTLGHGGMHGPATHETAGHATGMRAVGDTAVMADVTGGDRLRG